MLRPGGRLVLSVWGPRDEVPLIRYAQDCIARVLPPPRIPRPSVFRLGTREALGTLLGDAGFEAVRCSDHRLVCRFESAEAYWQAFLDLAGGAAGALARLDPALQARLCVEVATDLTPARSGDAYATDSLVLLAEARR